MMIPFLALVRKDLKLFFTDRKAVVVGLLVPIICGSFFGYLFGGHKGSVETSKVPVLVMDQDESEISRALVTQLTAEKNLEIKPSTPVAAREAVRKGKAIAAIIIPKDFGEDSGRALFQATTKPTLGLLYDPSHDVELGMVKGILSGAVMQSVSQEMFRGRSGREMVNQSLA
jgi:ABC-2 type transport system permease protein